MKCPRCNTMMEPHSGATADQQKIRTTWLCPGCFYRTMTLAPNYHQAIIVEPPHKRGFRDHGGSGVVPGLETVMNRRNFFSTLAKATAGFMILPAATTYGRVWRAERAPLDLDALRCLVYDIRRKRPNREFIDVYTDRATADMYVKALESAWDQQYAEFLRNGGWGRINDMPLARQEMAGWRNWQTAT